MTQLLQNTLLLYQFLILKHYNKLLDFNNFELLDTGRITWFDESFG